MRPIRQRLSWVFSCWLVLQLAAMAAPAVLLAAGYPVEEELCTCPGAEHGATCPMHRSPNSPRTNDDSSCSLRSGQTSLDAALLSLLGGAGLLPPSATLDVPIVAPFTAATSTVVPSRTERPDFQPPRS